MGAPLTLGIAGLGTVGASVVRMIAERQDDLARQTGRAVNIVAVNARDRGKDRGVDLSGMDFADSAVDLATRDDVDVFVELIGGDEGPALESVEAALGARKAVVTANKALIAKHGNRLLAMAETAGVAFQYEAAVAGGIPIIKTLREAVAGNVPARISGILNGTCNYILTTMEREGSAFGDVLKDAQDLGYAEADPTFDIGGHDTAHKLAILTSLAFGCQIAADDIYVEGIETIALEDIRAADQLGYRIKLLGVAQRTDTGIEQRVHPTMVPKSSTIAGVSGVLNAVALETDALGSSLLVGPGAGGSATASAVVADIADLARGAAPLPFARPAGGLAPYRKARMQAHEGGYYIRFSVSDEPGVFAQVATHMADAGISLQSIVQKRDLVERRGTNGGSGGESADLQPIVLITHNTTEAAIRDAVQKIEGYGFVNGRAQVIRIEVL